MIFSPRGLAIAIVLSLAVLTTPGCDTSAEPPREVAGDPAVASPVEPPIERPAGALEPEPREQPVRPSTDAPWQKQMFALLGELRSLHARIDECFPNMAELKTTEQYHAASVEANAKAEELQSQAAEISEQLAALRQHAEAREPDDTNSGEFLVTAGQRLDSARERIDNLRSLADSLAGAAKAIDGSNRQDQALKLVTLATELEGKVPLETKRLRRKILHRMHIQNRKQKKRARPGAGLSCED